MSTIFRKANPRRPVDWRWQLAGELIERGGRISRSRRDDELKVCRHFRGQLARCQQEVDYLQVMYAEPDMWEAWSLYADSDEKEIRWELEARLLAREPVEDIATKLAISVETAQLFESCFFNVQDRLDSPSYITQIVIGRSIHAGLNERHYDLLWKMYGYWAGSHVLDALIYRFNNPTRPENPEGTTAFWEDDTAETLRMKAAITMRTMPINWQTQEGIMNVYLRMLEMERNAGESGAGTEAVMANISSMLTSIPWHKHRQDIDVVDHSDPIAHVDAGQVSLRATELAIVGATGKVPPALEHMIAGLRFPEDTNDENDR
jgi:hypothetical protein